MTADRQAHTDRQTDTLITIQLLCSPIGGGVIITIGNENVPKIMINDTINLFF